MRCKKRNKGMAHKIFLMSEDEMSWVKTSPPFALGMFECAPKKWLDSFGEKMTKQLSPKTRKMGAPVYSTTVVFYQK
jgi:hypothetical protein